jgi:hypothetical protein
MVLPSAPRIETLFRIYFGLLAIAIVLCGVLANRHVARAGGGEVVTAAPRDTIPRSHGGPTINWGGQKR